MTTSDEQLRTDRLVFYEQDIKRLEQELDGFLELSGARCALLIDKDGHLVTRRGEQLGSSMDSIAALIAGSFAATRELARHFGQKEFENLTHQGPKDNIQLQLVGQRTLFGIVFDDRTNLGMVRFYAQETSRRLDAILEELAARPEGDGDDGLDPGFSEDAAAVLDSLF